VTSPSRQPVRRPARDRRVVVVGAGPAGLMAAIAAAGAGAAVTVCEQLDRAGAKLMATGGGRCNVTRDGPPDAFCAAYGRQGRFAGPALAAMDAAALRRWLAGLGVETVVESGGAVFCADGAPAVRAALLRRCAAASVDLRVKTAVRSLRIASGAVIAVATGAGDLPADCVVIAAGGRSYPDLGGTGGGYGLARQAGHDVIAPTPALVGLRTRESWPRRCAGVALPAASLRIGLRGRAARAAAGGVLFTHHGISGPAVLDLSGDVARLLLDRPDVPLVLSMTDTPPAEWSGRIDGWRTRFGRKHVRTLVADALPRRVADVLCDLAGAAPETRAAELPAEAARALAAALTALTLTVVGTDGFARAMVTRGGVALRQVDPRTLGSRLTRGVLLAGEVLDLDGPCGGYNLQWAFASGRLAGASAGGAGR